MLEYYKLPCETIGQTQWWEHVSSPPNHNGWVWGFFPEIGNDDEGYGFIDVVYWDTFGSTWRDRNGECSPQPLMWCDINRPIIPMLHPTREGSREAALQRITKAD